MQDSDRMWRGKSLEKREITYVTNPSAFDKYLDEEILKQAGVNWDSVEVPKHLRRSTFEVLEEYGIEGAKKQLPKYELDFHPEMVKLEEEFIHRQRIAIKHGTESKEYKELCKI